MKQTALTGTAAQAINSRNHFLRANDSSTPAALAPASAAPFNAPAAAPFSTSVATFCALVITFLVETFVLFFLAPRFLLVVFFCADLLADFVDFLLVFLAGILLS